MTPAELARVRRRLVAFAAEVFEPLARADQRRWGECYLRGLMLDGKRKSIQPMAERLPDGDEQALQQFVSQSPWDWRPVRQRLATQMTAAVDPDAWIVDDTGFPKYGNASVGVARQYSGTLGKVANCQVGVSIHAASDQASCPIGWRLFLPESWDQDQARRHAAHLPERVRHRPKWQLTLDMLDELDGWGLRPPVVVTDAGYGESGELRLGLEARGLAYVVQVKGTTSAYPEAVQQQVAPYGGRGRPPRARYRAKRSSLAQLVLAAGPSGDQDGCLARGDPRQAPLAVCGAAGPPGRGQAAPRRRRRGASGALAAGRVARRPGDTGQVLAGEPARGGPAGGAGAAGQAALAHRARLPRAQRRPRP
jgi:SRSO17 transposase